MTDSISPVWLAMSVSLVLLLQAGLALHYAGSSRAKDAVNVLMHAFLGCSGVALVYWAVGDAVAWGNSAGGWLGTSGLAPAATGPAQALTLLFHMVLATTAFVIVCGATAERMRTSAALLFAVVLGGVLYPVLSHWMQHPQGWLRQLGLIDLGASGNLHMLAGWCALAGALALGPRLGRYAPDGSVRAIPAHHLPMAVLGVWLAGVGWSGLQGGSATLVAGGTGSTIGAVLVNTYLAAGAGALSAAAWAWTSGRDARVRGVLNGFLGGLVAISAGAAVMATPMAVLTGLAGGLLSSWGAQRLRAARIDDASDAVAVHGLCGMWGLLAAGLFYESDAFALDRVLVQALGAFASFAWTLPVAYVALKAIDRLCGLRVTSMDEMRGADYSQHRELAYPEFQDSIARLRHEA